jgi:CRP-like cAMP-binding protein
VSVQSADGRPPVAAPIPIPQHTVACGDASADAAADAFAEQVIEAGGSMRLRALLATSRPEALYYLPDRHGISVVAVPSTGLTAHEIASLLTFRFAQYLDIGFVDRGIACAQDMRGEPAGVVAPGDVHVVAGVPATGEILGYAVIEQSPLAAAGCRLRSGERDLFPVERVHGAGVFDRLPILPDLAVSKVRELGRFVRNHRPVAGRDLAIRAMVETGVAVYRLMTGPLRLQVDAVVGDLEEHVAKHNLDFFHIPSVVVHGTVPYASRESHLGPRYQLHTVYPFACLTSDIETAVPRLVSVEQALAKPGNRGLLALLRLRGQPSAAVSMLRRRDGIDQLDEMNLPQRQTSMAQRSLLLEQGQWLRQIPPFAGLSVSEAAMLCALMRRVEVPAGHVIARQGETAHALFVIERGDARIELADQGATVDPVATVGPGHCFGHFGVLAGAEHPANIVASTDMTLLRLSKADHDTYLAQLPGVDKRLGKDALRQLAELDRHRRLHPARPASPTGDGCGCGDTCECQGHDHPSASDTNHDGGQPTVTASRR